MLRPDVQASYSDLWYRVTDSRPRLSPHARIVRQRYGPGITFIVEDPAGGHYYRLSEPAYFFLGLLDGRTSIDEAWEACCVQLGDAAPSQREIINLLAQLQLFGLLVGDQPLSSEMLEQRIEQAKSDRFHRRAGRFVFPSLPLINPEPFLQRTEGFWRFVFSKVGLAIWLVTVSIALLLVVPRYREFGSAFNGLLDPRNLIYMSVLFLLIRAIHELGHAGACKAMGGRCTEIGVILIALVLPLPYCDASSAWRFPELSKRVLVSAAGMLVEFFFAAMAGIVWAVVDPRDAPLIHALAFNMMVISSVTTLVFNINPLLRYDGYYILSDVMGIPNLAQRSRTLWQYLIERYAFGIGRLKQPAVRDRSEFWVMTLYGVLSPPYRLFIGVSILLLISSQYLTVGVLIAGVMAAIWFVWPVTKGLTYLFTSPKLLGRRTRAVSLVGSLTAVVVLLVGVVPAPASGYAHGVLEPTRRELLRAREDGFIKAVHVRPGDAIGEEHLVIELENPLIEQRLEMARIKVREAEINLDRAIEAAPELREIALRRLETAHRRLERAELAQSRMRVTSSIAGRVVAPSGTGIDLENLEGRFVSKGTALAMVASIDQLRLTAQMSDREFAHVFPDADLQTARDRRAMIRVRGRSAESTDGRLVSLARAGFRRLENQASSTAAGGSFAMDPNDPDREATLMPLFTVQVEPIEQPGWWQPGLRAKVRFPLDSAPLATQLWRRARQYLSGRLAA